MKFKKIPGDFLSEKMKVLIRSVIVHILKQTCFQFNHYFAHVLCCFTAVEPNDRNAIQLLHNRTRQDERKIITRFDLTFPIY